MSEREFKEKFVTFVDILGFKEDIYQAKDNEEELNKIADKVEVIQNYFGTRRADLTGYRNYNVSATSFTDCVIREREYSEGCIFSELYTLSHAQASCVAYEVVVRGAVSFGLHHKQDDTIVSPAGLKAYELEAKFAKFPRIIIDPALLAEYEHRKDWTGSAHPHEDDKNYVYDQLIKDPEDGLYFLDYLSHVYKNSDEEGPYALDQILKIQNTIIFKGLKNPSPSIRKKYQWLGWYQNYIINKFKALEKVLGKNWVKNSLIDERLL